MAFDPTQVDGAGHDQLEKSSTLPIIRIIQDQSPEINKRKEEYIDGAEAGDLLWNLDKSILARPLEFVPVGGVSLYTEWTPKDEGGGFHGYHPLTIVNHPDYEKGRKKKHDEWLGQHELKYTRYECILAFIHGEWKRALLAMTSTQLHVARKLSQEIAKFRYPGLAVIPPVFARKWKLSTVLEKTTSDQEYFNFKIDNPEVLDFTTDEKLLNMANEASKTARASLPSPRTSAPVAALKADDTGTIEEHVF